jgi:hypothetical protein
MGDDRRILEASIEDETAGMQPRARLLEGMTPTPAQMRAAAQAPTMPQPPPAPKDSSTSARPGGAQPSLGHRKDLSGVGAHSRPGQNRTGSAP